VPVAEEAGQADGPDVGAVVLAAVENARTAIAHKDAISAGNDLDAARTYATRLMAQPSTLFSGPPGPDGEQLTDFVVVTRLLAAEGEVDSGDLPGADAHLRIIEDGVAKRFLPRDFALLRTREGLERAAAARRAERRAELATQLLTARTALAEDAGTAGDADRQALLKSIDEARQVSADEVDAVSAESLRSLSGRAAGMIGNGLTPL
jgi:hypothetical protein